MSNTADPSSIPLHSLTNLINIKLNSTNYLTWEKQVTPVLTYLKLVGHIDGSIPIPPETITTENKLIVNPEFISWKANDQKVLLLINSTLTEESMAETIEHNTALSVWKALVNAYSHCSIERVHNLTDTLRNLQKGNSTVSKYGRKLAIGHPISDEDKRHWFLCGLNAAFENFSTSQRTIHPAPSFRDLLNNAENQELFVQKFHGSQTPEAAFYANQTKHNRPSSRGCGRSNSSRGRGSTYSKRTPHCQLCRKDGHYAPACPNLASYANKSSSIDANLAQAFHAQCNINSETPDWTADSGPKDGGSSC